MTFTMHTKIVEIDGGIALRWFWRDLETFQESPVGFLDRTSCEADAVSRGYTPDNSERRFWF